MTSRILAVGLLRTAEKLVPPHPGPGRPALADLRRATSTAYYALFHQIARHGALDFLPTVTEAEIADVSRWFTHTGVLKAAQLVIEAASPAPIDQVRKERRVPVMSLRSAAGGGPLANQLVTVADSFQTLQVQRHRADYDSNYDPYRATTLAHVAEARTALDAAWWLWLSGDTRQQPRWDAHASYRCFLRLALLYSGVPKAR